MKNLQAAVKYGVKELGYPHPKTKELRYKYTYMDVVYITDATSTIEITSWALALPIDKVAISPRMMRQVEEARHRLCDRRIVTSHTVLVVDQSASMRKSDMNGHRSRSRAVYYELAHEFLAPRLRPISTGNPFSDSTTEVVTLIEMRDTPTVVFEFEPVSWVLYNKFVDLAEKPLKEMKSHGNYAPAMKMAMKILQVQSDNRQCALALFFLTDGRPSDAHPAAGARATTNFPRVMLEEIFLCTRGMADRLTFQAVGFGTDSESFDILTTMTDIARSAGAMASMSRELTSALTSIVHSTTTLTSKLSKLNFAVGTDDKRVRTGALKGIYNPNASFLRSEWSIFNTRDVHTLQTKREELVFKENPRTRKWEGKWQQVSPFQAPGAVGFMVKNDYLGEGAERIVFEMREIDRAGVPIGQKLVAKDSLWLHSERVSKTDFHKVFIQTQMKAESYAKKFNAKLDQLGLSKFIPRIYFIPCSIYSYQCEDVSGTISEMAYLAEPMLDVSRYNKWNDNAGGVDGAHIEREHHYELNSIASTAVSISHDFASLSRAPAAPILENLQEVDEEESDDDNDDDAAELQPHVLNDMEGRIFESDVPQAFTHFSYVWSKRKLMVCDLQGILDYSGEFPCFRYTDPCIHNVDAGKRRANYGRTNKGAEGMRNFFKTHKCNQLCELLTKRK